VSGTARLRVLLANEGEVELPQARLKLRWTFAIPGPAGNIGIEQQALELPALAVGKTARLESEVTVPVNSMCDASIALVPVSTDGVDWTSRGAPLAVHRRIMGQDAAHASPEFDYEAAYRAADLEHDYWSIVGPASRTEYEALGRGKCEQLLSLGLNARSRVLDIGCGTGQLTEALTSVLGTEGVYYGTDLAAEAIAFCRNRFRQPNFHFFRNEQGRIPIEGIRFDILYLGSVLTHMYPSDIARMLGEMRRLMDDDGCVVVDALVSPKIADYVGSRAMIQLNEPWLLAQFSANGFEYRELFSTHWNDGKRVIYHLTALADMPSRSMRDRERCEPTRGYDVWRQARLSERRGLAGIEQGAWHHLITVLVYGGASGFDALSRTLSTLRDQTYRNIEIVVAAVKETDLPDAGDFASLRGLFAEPTLDPLNVLSDASTDRLWRGGHLVFAAAGTTFDPDAFALLNGMLSPAPGALPPDFVVCDHDRTAAHGSKPEPCFLPGWDPDLIVAMDYVGSAFMASRKLVLDQRSRGRPGSLHDWLVNLATGSGPLAAAHLTETVMHLVTEMSRPVPARSVPLPKARAGSVAIVITNRDRPDLLARCIRFLDFYEGSAPELVIVDHASTDPATLAIYAELEKTHGARIRRIGGAFNFSRMVNLGVAATSAEVVVLMNNDIEVTAPGQIEAIIDHARRAEIGVVGARLLYPNGQVQHAGLLLRPGVDQRKFPVIAEHVLRGAPRHADGYLHALRTIRNYQAVTGALMATRRAVFENVGGFDEVNLPVEFNDVDFCLRVRAMGLRVVVLPTDGIVHRESSTRTTRATPEVQTMRSAAMALIADRWSDAVNRDPFCSPWACLGEVPEVRFPWMADR
jgi:GT2 family glycosyltransferase/SAM-dependent methyltransferase